MKRGLAGQESRAGEILAILEQSLSYNFDLIISTVLSVFIGALICFD